MVDVFAALSLASAAARTENPIQLFSDAETLYAFYMKAKLEKPNFEALAASGELKTLVAAASHVTAVAGALTSDPTQMKNITALLQSI